MMKSDPVPCDFLLVAAGNLDSLNGMHPALRSRIRGYGYEIYVKNLFEDSAENRRKLVRFVAQEVSKDRKIPHFDNGAMAEIILEAGPQDFDSAHVFDPAIVSWRDKFHLYYSALGDGPESIGLAVSTNGVDFKKYDRPLLLGRSPEVIDVTGMLFLFYVLKNDLGEYRIHLARSADGEHFTPLSDEPVLTVGAAGEWDAGEVTTPRLFSHNGIFYMLYSGSSSPERKDIPQAFGLARSTDLLKNAVYTCR